MSDFLKCIQLCKSYSLGRNHIVHGLKDASLILQRNSWLSITGPSGSGKSTLLALLAGLDRPTSGNVFFQGERLSGANDVRLARYRKEKVGIVFQEYQLFEELNSVENVAMPLVVSNMTAKERQERAMELLERVGLMKRAQHLPRQLSGGERQRVAVARALIHDPEIIFADEPTSNIDRAAAGKVLDLFRLFQESGKSLVVVSHSDDMVKAADTQLTMEAGRIVV